MRFVFAGCSNRPDFSPTRPRRAETRLLPGKAAASEGQPEAYPQGYVKDAFETRTMPGNGRVSARRGLAGENSGCFSIPLVEGERNGRKGQDKHGKGDPSDNDPILAQRYVQVAHGRMSETPQSGHEGPEPPARPAYESQHNENRNHHERHCTLA
jgi:hypothetical protein